MRKKSILVIFCIFFISYYSTAQNDSKKYKAYLVSNAHLDTQWRWDVKTSIDEFLYNTVVQNLYLLDNYPNYIFNCEGAIKYAWIKEYYPDLYKRVSEYVKQGRWHLSGASWDATDPNMPSTESFFRNILLAQTFYKREFGIKSQDLFLPDCFGFGYTMPSVTNHCDLLGFSTQKLSWRSEPLVGKEKTPFPIGLWQGVDGSRIMVALESGRYTQGFAEGDLSNDKDLLERATKTSLPIVYKYFGGLSNANGNGDKGGSPAIRTVQLLEEGLKGKGPIEIISASSDQLYKDYYPYDKHPELPVYDGEMLLDVHAPGCYTSQAEMKRYNRRNEQLADAAERSAVIADWLGGLSYPSDALNDAWKRFIWHQFHDDLTGTSIWQAYTYSWNDEIIAQSQFCDVMTSSTGATVSLMNTQTKGEPIVVYNPTAYSRESIVEADLQALSGSKSISVYSPEGKQVPAQVISKKDGKMKILFPTKVGSVGYSVYDVRAGNPKQNSNLKATNNTIENKIYKVKLNEDGNISSIIDKRNNKELVESGKTLGLIVLTPNISNRYPAWEIHKETLDRESEKINENVKISIQENGPVRAALKVERTYGDSKFVQYIRLTDGGNDDRIDIVTDIDWATKDALLKAEFPLSVSNEKATYDIGLGAIQRSTNKKDAHETYAHHWADITNKDESYGVSILNNCKYGWDKPNDNTLRLTLLHTPSTEKRYADQRDLDFGKHTVTYSIVGHTGNYKKAGIVKKGEELNQPLIAFTTDKHNGKLGKSFSFASSSTPQIAIKAIKKAEDGDGYIVRIHETEGREAINAEIIFNAPIKSAIEVNGTEEHKNSATYKGNKLIVNAGYFAPKTYKVILEKSLVTPMPVENKPIELPFNQIAISSDHFRPMAKMDKECNSYAAELIPETIVHGGIDFKTGPADLKNALTCDSNVIVLPSDKQYDRLYILAASSDKDRNVSFYIDDKEYKATIPYYTGFIAQWAWNNHTKSFVKEGTIAHIGSHLHTPKGNDSYTFTYMFKIALDIPAGAKKLVLPKDNKITIFAITTSNNKIDNTKLACEPRALPIIK